MVILYILISLKTPFKLIMFYSTSKKGEGCQFYCIFLL